MSIGIYSATFGVSEGEARHRLEKGVKSGELKRVRIRLRMPNNSVRPTNFYVPNLNGKAKS